MDSDHVRKVLLEIVVRMSARGEHAFGPIAAITEACTKLGIGYSPKDQSAVFDAWDDLYRSGVVSYGRDLSNPGMGWARLSSRGQAAARSLSRDPSNPHGYREAIAPSLAGQDVALAYLDEALATYNRDCFKASAVMIGCAAEALHLDLRERLVVKMRANGVPVPPALLDWRMLPMLKCLQDELAKRVKDMPRDLKERFEAHWASWSGLFRMTRNEVGHPTSVSPVTQEQVHASLLMFHEQARLSRDLAAWVDSSY